MTTTEFAFATAFALMFTIMLELAVPGLFSIDSGKKECHICVGDSEEYPCNCKIKYENTLNSILFKSFIFIFFALVIIIIFMVIKEI